MCPRGTLENLYVLTMYALVAGTLISPGDHLVRLRGVHEERARYEDVPDGRLDAQYVLATI